MAVTIKQIAAKAGVSCGTVDRALHHRPGVNPQVAARILEIAEELQYQPNTLAKALANSGKDLMITILLHARGNAFYQEVLNGMEAAAAHYSEYGIRLHTVLLKGYDVVKQINALKEIEQESCAGLILTPINDARVCSLLNRISQTTQIISLNADLKNLNKLCFVGCDYYGSGQLAASLFGMMLPENQPAKVAVVAGSLHQSGHKQRVEGFEDALKTDFPYIQIEEILQNDDDDALSEQLIIELAEKQPDLNGIFFCAGGTRGGLQAVRSWKAPAPRIITVDETEPVRQGLLDKIVSATIIQNPYEQGYQAVKAACEKILFNKNPVSENLIMRSEIRLRCQMKNSESE